MNGRGLVVQLLPAVDDTGAELNGVAGDEDQGFSLLEQKFRLPLVLAVGLGLLKFQQSIFPVQLQEHGSNICHDVAVLLPRQLRDLVARHRERAFNEIRRCLIGFSNRQSALFVNLGLHKPVPFQPDLTAMPRPDRSEAIR